LRNSVSIVAVSTLGVLVSLACHEHGAAGDCFCKSIFGPSNQDSLCSWLFGAESKEKGTLACRIQKEACTHWNSKNTVLSHIPRWKHTVYEPQSLCVELSFCKHRHAAWDAFALGATLARSFALRTGIRCCYKGQELVGWIGRWVHLWGLLFFSFLLTCCLFIFFMFVVMNIYLSSACAHTFHSWYACLQCHLPPSR